MRGHRVEVANNGREAIAALEQQPFDLVLMDLEMPEMDGLEAAAAIRAKEAVSGGHIPIIAMTAHAVKGFREQLPAGRHGRLHHEADQARGIVQGRGGRRGGPARVNSAAPEPPSRTVAEGQRSCTPGLRWPLADFRLHACPQLLREPFQRQAAVVHVEMDVRAGSSVSRRPGRIAGPASNSPSVRIS